MDTHAFLWWLEEDSKLGEEASRAIADPENTIFVSAVSLWEIAIKAKQGRLEAPLDILQSEIEVNDFVELPIHGVDALAAGALPLHHGDPFDRMLIAQAQLKGCSVLTRDRAFGAYNVSLISAGL